MEYTIVEASGPVALVEVVKGFISDGWQPIGGHTVHIKPDQSDIGLKQAMAVYSQALVRGRE